jgi:phage recombination protein Bet
MPETIAEPRIIVAEDGKTYTFDEVATYVKYHAPDATQAEIEEFFNYCRIRSLSPYDVHFIKWGKTQKPTIVVGKDAFLKRAERSKQLDGYKAGVIVEKDGKIQYKDGAFYIRDKEELVGGWAEVYRKDFSHPVRTEVSLDEYLRVKKDGSVMENWAKMPATMIRKVALVQALREAFPGEMSGMYVAEEMGVDLETGEVSDGRLDVPSDRLNTDSVNPTDRPGKPITNAQRKKIIAEAQKVYGKDEWKKKVHALMQVMFNKESSKELTREEASELIEYLMEIKPSEEKTPADTETEELFGGANG